MERREREPGAIALPSRRKPQADREANAEEKIRSLLWRYQPEFVLAGNLDIIFTRSSNTPVSLSQQQDSGTLRLHVLFSMAPDSILEDVIRFCFARRNQVETKNLRARILDYVGENRHQTIATMSEPGPCSPKGKIYDLEKTLRRVISKYVPERRLISSRPAIGWSKRPTIKLMGKWIETSPGERNVIIINRLLDDERVPAYYLEYNVYHELLHDLFSIHRSQGRWIRHPAELQAREKTYPLYTRAREWEINELQSLTRAENAIR
jgi:hypothetical protein